MARRCARACPRTAWKVALPYSSGVRAWCAGSSSANVWINGPNFHDLKDECDPIIGTQDGTLEYKIPNRPVRRLLKGLPAFTTVRGGAYFILCPESVP